MTCLLYDQGLRSEPERLVDIMAHAQRFRLIRIKVGSETARLPPRLLPSSHAVIDCCICAKPCAFKERGIDLKQTKPVPSPLYCAEASGTLFAGLAPPWLWEAIS